MYDGYTFVDVPAEYAEDVLNAMSHARIKGKHIHVEKSKFQEIIGNHNKKYKRHSEKRRVSFQYAGSDKFERKKSRSRSKDQCNEAVGRSRDPL